jgi:hypothetical protein
MLKSATIAVTDDGVENNTVITDPNGLEIVDTARSITHPLPNDFYLYVRSVSNVSSTFSFKATIVNNEDYIQVATLPTGADIDESKTYIHDGKKKKYEVITPAGDGVAEVKGWVEHGDYKPSAIRVIPNMLSSQSDVWKLIETPHDSLRILRYPAAVLNKYTESGKPTLSVIYDRYTVVNGIKIVYYKEPKHFDLMTSTACELPIDAFDDLVSGAVDLYVQYAAGAEARKRQMQQEQQRQNRRRNNDEDED